MTDQDNAQALLALAKARGIEIDPNATHLTLPQVAALASEAEITTRRAIWKGFLPAERIMSDFCWRYMIPVVDAARYVAQGGGRLKARGEVT